MAINLLSSLQKRHWSRRKKLGWFFGSLVVYMLIFGLLYNQIGGALLALSFLPVSIVAWSMGLRAGVIAALLMLPFNTVILILVGAPDLPGAAARGIPGHIVLVVIGSAIGWLSQVLGKVQEQSARLEREHITLQQLIAERVRSEVVLRKSERQFQDLFENSPDAIFVENLDGVVLDVNQAACKLHRMTREELIGKSVLELVPADLREQVASDFPKLSKDGVDRVESMSLTKDGRFIPVEIRISQLEYRGAPALLLHVRDIRVQKRIEDALVVAFDQALEASRLKSELLAMVSHELRTPLNTIIGFSEILELGIYGPLTDKQTETIHQISASTDYLLEMVNQLLDQAQIEAGKLRLNVATFPIRDVVERTQAKMRVLAEAKGLELINTIEDNVPDTFFGDSARINQILVNLVGNAIKFTERGHVHVRVYCPNEKLWALDVSDTGAGIPEEAQAAIFEPFSQVDSSVTRAYGGSGLGLSIVRELTKLMGGETTLTSQIGQGTTFTVTLPVLTSDQII